MYMYVCVCVYTYMICWFQGWYGGYKYACMNIDLSISNHTNAMKVLWYIHTYIHTYMHICI
jgi:hypothetical protein